MKFLKKFNLAMILLVVITALSACSLKSDSEKNEQNVASKTQSHENSSNYPVEVTTYDFSKNPVQMKFKQEPKRVVAVYQNSIETLLALGLEDKIVGCAGLDHKVKSEYEKSFEGVNYLNEFTPSKESVLMLEPDLIVGWYSLFANKNLGDMKFWNDKDINTYMALNSGALESKTIENECKDIANIGKIFNVEDKAQKIIDEINVKVDKVSKLVKDKQPVSAMIIEFNKDEITCYGKSTLGGDMVSRLGANLLESSTNKISKEDIVKMNPDAIFVVYMDRENEDVANESVEKIINDKAFQSLDAISSNSIYPVRLGDMYCSGIRTIDGINAFAGGLYPDIKVGQL